MKVFFDSSALAKRYIEDEMKSDQIDRLVFEADSVAVSSICLPEVISAFARLRREKKLSTAQYNQCKRSAIEDFSTFEVCQLSPEVIRRSIILLENAELRTLDALQLACAIETKESVFVSSDKRQLAAARKFSLKANPV